MVRAGSSPEAHSRTMMKQLVIGLALLTGVVAPLAAQAPTLGRETSIAYAGNGGIRDWEGDGAGGMFLRDRTGQWYHASFVGQCPNLGWSRTIVVNTDPLGTLDKFGSIDTASGRCSIASLVKSKAPLSRDSRGR